MAQLQSCISVSVSRVTGEANDIMYDLLYNYKGFIIIPFNYV